MNKNLKIGDILKNIRDLNYYIVTSILEDDISDSTWETRPHKITRYSVNLVYTNIYTSKLDISNHYTTVFCYEIDNDTRIFTSISKQKTNKKIKFLKLLYG